ncbi:hypothetical protein [Natronoarchaeum rubrum]|uniref:hypothetical protein n=1 Tax=Natronoarchaeum rubrum TaxID=755311 RepID=UPI0021127418|nr:hypothetical protein [Natronoarchaeum rubrum]
MASRYDVVLAVLPLLILSGVVVESFAGAIEHVAGIGGGVEQLPLVILGALAAAALVGHELTISPPTAEEH